MTLARRLAALEARVPPPRPPRPPLDLDRLTPAERVELENVSRLVRWDGGRPDFDALDDAALERLETLVKRATSTVEAACPLAR